jgi:hypothetical protein
MKVQVNVQPLQTWIHIIVKYYLARFILKDFHPICIQTTWQCYDINVLKKSSLQTFILHAAPLSRDIIVHNDLGTVLHKSVVKSAADAIHRNKRAAFKSYT